MLESNSFFRRANLGLVAGITLGVFLAAYLGIELTRESGRIASIWLANAVVLAALLRTAPKRWAGWLLCGLIGNLAANRATGDASWLAAALSLCNTVEILLVAALCRWREPGIGTGIPNPRSVLTFFVAGGILGPAASGALAASMLHVHLGLPFGLVFWRWLPADALGLLILVPLLMTMSKAGLSEGRGTLRKVRALASLLPIALASVWIVGGGHPSWLFLVSPLILLSTFTFGYLGAASGIFLAAACGLGSLVLRAHLGHLQEPREEIGLLQVFLFTNVLIFLPVASLLSALRVTGANFRLLFDHAPVGLAVLDSTSGRFRSANSRLGEILEVAPEALLDKTFQDFTHPEHLEADLESVRDLASGAAQELVKDKRYLLPSGKVVWAHLKMVNLPVAPGEPPQHLSLVEDITARMEVESALRDSATQNQALLRAIPDLMFLVDRDGRYLDFRAYDARLLYAPPEQFLHKTMAEVLPRPLADRFMAATARALADNEIQTFQYELEVAGAIRWFEARVVPCGEDRVVLIARDVSEGVKAEATLRLEKERYRGLFEHMHSGFILLEVILDPEGRPVDHRLLEANAEFEAQTGLQRERELGRTSAELSFQWPADVAQSLYKVVMDQASTSYERFNESLQKHFDVRAFSPAPGQLGMLFNDITERKRAEQENLRVRAEVEHMQKLESLGRLAGGVAHDMNNVLGAILALASAHLVIPPQDPAVGSAFETIRDAAFRGGDLVKRLLTFARQSPVTMREVDLNALLLEQTRLLARTTLAKVRLDVELAPALRSVHGDGSALTHVFMNICVNAVDAMGEGGTLTFRTRNVGDDQVEVVIQDTGAGMTEAVLARATDPFFTTKEVGKGTGLGLSMAFTIVTAHGGQMKLESQPGRGTRVRLRFPAMETKGPEETRLQASIHPVKAILKVLLIDDDELIRKATRMLVEVVGHAVTLASSGEEALALIGQGFRPDVVILDMNMPGLGGKGTLPLLRDVCPQVPILVATGRVDQETLELVDAHPFLTLMAKPFTFEVLQGHLERVAGGAGADPGR